MTETPAEAPDLVLEIDGPIAWIVARNPARMNAFTAGMWAKIPEHIATAEGNADVRVIVLRGAETRAFSAGADISEFESARTGDAAADYDRLNHEAFSALLSATKPLIAMIHGFCLRRRARHRGLRRSPHRRPESAVCHPGRETGSRLQSSLGATVARARPAGLHQRNAVHGAALSRRRRRCRSGS